MKITLEITEDDFERLTDCQMEWNDSWKAQEDRFEYFTHTKGFVFWVDSYTSLILCRSFLEARGDSCVVMFDTSQDQYCFVTSYASRWETANV
jgi:hypothetical protein